MRYNVNGRQAYSVLKKADEIKVYYEDRDKIMDFVEKIPEATIILDYTGTQKEWKLWQMYSEKFAEFHVMLHDLYLAPEFNEAGINWYWFYPITSFYELNMIVKLKPSYVILGAPLCFDLKKVKNIVGDIPVRLVANIANMFNIPNIEFDSVCGPWIRPEDVSKYEEYVQAIDFAEANTAREETLLQIYKYDQKWPGNLNLLIDYLNINVDNRAFPDEFGEIRTTCGQRCQSGSGCRFCHRALSFAKTLKTSGAKDRT